MRIPSAPSRSPSQAVTRPLSVSRAKAAQGMMPSSVLNRGQQLTARLSSVLSPANFLRDSWTTALSSRAPFTSSETASTSAAIVAASCRIDASTGVASMSRRRSENSYSATSTEKRRRISRRSAYTLRNPGAIPPTIPIFAPRRRLTVFSDWTVARNRFWNCWSFRSP